jgi:hypothetical protein
MFQLHQVAQVMARSHARRLKIASRIVVVMRRALRNARARATHPLVSRMVVAICQPHQILQPLLHQILRPPLHQVFQPLPHQMLQLPLVHMHQVLQPPLLQVRQILQLTKPHQAIHNPHPLVSRMVVVISQLLRLLQVAQALQPRQLVQVAQALQMLQLVQVAQALQMFQLVQVAQALQMLQLVQVAQALQMFQLVQVAQVLQLLQLVQVAQALQMLQLVQVAQAHQILQLLQVVQVMARRYARRLELASRIVVVMRSALRNARARVTYPLVSRVLVAICQPHQILQLPLHQMLQPLPHQVPQVLHPIMVACHQTAVKLLHHHLFLPAVTKWHQQPHLVPTLPTVARTKLLFYLSIFFKYHMVLRPNYINRIIS